MTESDSSVFGVMPPKIKNCTGLRSTSTIQYGISGLHVCCLQRDARFTRKPDARHL